MSTGFHMSRRGGACLLPLPRQRDEPSENKSIGRARSLCAFDACVFLRSVDPTTSSNVVASDNCISCYLGWSARPKQSDCVTCAFASSASSIRAASTACKWIASSLDKDEAETSHGTLMVAEGWTEPSDRG